MALTKFQRERLELDVHGAARVAASFDRKCFQSLMAARASFYHGNDHFVGLNSAAAHQHNRAAKKHATDARKHQKRLDREGLNVS